MSFDDLVGRTLGQYELRELLGVGGMGTVYKAEAHDGKLVALKMLHRHQLAFDVVQAIGIGFDSVQQGRQLTAGVFQVRDRTVQDL